MDITAFALAVQFKLTFLMCQYLGVSAWKTFTKFKNERERSYSNGKTGVQQKVKPKEKMMLIMQSWEGLLACRDTGCVLLQFLLRRAAGLRPGMSLLISLLSILGFHIFLVTLNIILVLTTPNLKSPTHTSLLNLRLYISHCTTMSS